MTRTSAAFLAMAVLSVLLTGCGGGGVADAGPATCTLATECKGGEVCSDGRCLLVCLEPGSCPSGTTCSSGVCRAACSSTAQCGAGQACAGQACRPTSCGGQSCAPDHVCVDGACTASACVGVLCPQGQLCAAGECQPTSCGGVSCPSGQVCLGGACTDASCVGVVCPSGTCQAGLCLDASASLPYALLCDAMSRGFRNQTLVGARACGTWPGQDEDVAHQAFISFGGNAPSGATNQSLWSLFSCGPIAADGGLMSAYLMSMEASMDAGRVAYDGAKARACINAGAADGGVPAVCREVFVPLVPLGGACSLTEECPNGAFCRSTALGSCGGTCAPRLPVGAVCEPTRELCLDGFCTSQPDGGSVCRSTSPASGDPVGTGCQVPGATATCAPGLRCVINTSAPALPDGGPAGTCTAPVGLDGRCGTGPSVAQAPGCAVPCVSCYSADGGPGLCRPLGGPAAPCRVDGDCQEFHTCVGGNCSPSPRPNEPCTPGADGERGNCRWADNYCRRPAPDAGTGVCTNMPDVAQACGNRYDLTSSCATGTCDRTGAVGVCRPTPRLGEPCNGTCTGSLQCTSLDGGARVCAPYPTAGQACSGTCDSASTCVSGVCVPKPGVGSVCQTNSDCATNNCLAQQHVCAAACFSQVLPLGSYSPGCPNGIRDWTSLLAFSLLGLVWRGRRRD